MLQQRQTTRLSHLDAHLATGTPTAQPVATVQRLSTSAPRWLRPPFCRKLCPHMPFRLPLSGGRRVSDWPWPGSPLCVPFPPQTASAAYKAANDKVVAQLAAVKVVPVIALDSADDAVPLAHALK